MRTSKYRPSLEELEPICPPVSLLVGSPDPLNILSLAPFLLSATSSTGPTGPFDCGTNDLEVVFDDLNEPAPRLGALVYHNDWEGIEEVEGWNWGIYSPDTVIERMEVFGAPRSNWCGWSARPNLFGIHFWEPADYAVRFSAGGSNWWVFFEAGAFAFNGERDWLRSDVKEGMVGAQIAGRADVVFISGQNRVPLNLAARLLPDATRVSSVDEIVNEIKRLYLVDEVRIPFVTFVALGDADSQGTYIHMGADKISSDLADRFNEIRAFSQIQGMVESITIFATNSAYWAQGEKSLIQKMDDIAGAGNVCGYRGPLDVVKDPHGGDPVPLRGWTTSLVCTNHFPRHERIEAHD